MNGKKITLEAGKVYRNKGGGKFLCIHGFEKNAIMQNVVSGWTFKANGVIQYEDGSVEWDYSTEGHYKSLPKPCRLCEAKFDFRKLVIHSCAGEWTLGFRGGTLSKFSEEDRAHFCPECGRKLTDEDFRKKE